VGSKKIEVFADVDDAVDAMFPRGARQPSEKYRDAVVVLVPTVVVFHRKAELDGTAITALLNGQYVRLDKAPSKREVQEGLDLVKSPARRAGAKAFDAIDELELVAPS
jgi:hypothetical protein